MAYNEMIHKVHGGIELERWDQLLPPLRQLAAAAVDDQQECQLTVMGYVMRIEKCWLCEMLLQGSMKYRMINLQEFSFWGTRRGIVSRSFGQAQK
jgi:hypothetical protein